MAYLNCYDNSSVNMGVQMFLLALRLHSFIHIASGGIVGSNGSSIFVVLRNCYTGFVNICTNTKNVQGIPIKSFIILTLVIFFQCSKSQFPPNSLMCLCVYVCMCRYIGIYVHMCVEQVPFLGHHPAWCLLSLRQHLVVICSPWISYTG